MDARQRDQFVEAVWQFYGGHGRHDLPWRQSEPAGSFDPYKILVSELMLQQTQVPRVIPKYHAFLAHFPTIASLADAGLGDVLTVWNGLGYNRRAKFLLQAAQTIMRTYDGVFPDSPEQLVRLPGIGTNTAGAVVTYAFNRPVVFIETNVRTVFIHHFFPNDEQVDDKQLVPLVAETLDTKDPRQWFWALMDYGTYLKQTVGNVGRVSKTYTKQSTFAGSKRQLRGAIIRLLVAQPRTTYQLHTALHDDRLPEVLTQLVGEGMIQEKAGRFSIT